MRAGKSNLGAYSSMSGSDSLSKATNILDLIQRNKREEKREKIYKVYGVIGFVGLMFFLSVLLFYL